MERRQPSAVAFTLAAIVAASCTSTAPTTPVPGPTTAPPSPTPTAEARNRTVTALTGGIAPAGHAVTIDLASISEDRTVLTVSFSGGPAFDPSDPCSFHYVAWVSTQGDALSLDIEEQAAGVAASPGFACALVAFEHTYRIVLPAPFLGTTVDGLPLVPPAPVARLSPPAGWSVQLSFRVEAGPPTVWAESYAPEPVTSFSHGLWPGPVDVYEGLPHASDLLGANEQAQNDASPASVIVAGKPVTLWLRHDLPRYLMAWEVDGHDLAISADSTVFSAEQVVQLANGVTLPG